MKKIKIVVGIILLLLVSACSKDGGPTVPDTVNKPPGSFDLIGVTNGATNIDVLPTFNWKVSVDPDGDAVSYDLLLDTDADPTTVYAANLNGTTFKVTERLHLIANYHWKVVAKDGKGGSTQSTVYGFTTRNLKMPQYSVTLAAFEKGVYAHTTTLYANELFIIGGYDGSKYSNDVWESSDGEHWQKNLIALGFTPRYGHTTTEFHGELWVIGGSDGDLKNDVWHTGFGSDWVEATPAAPFSARSSHATVVFDDKIWVIGGSDGALKNDVWYSSDGKNWTQATAAAAFPARFGHTATVFHNKMWIIGGDNNVGKGLNDVWYSSDGVTWTEATTEAVFTGRRNHSTVVFDDKLWLFGGFSDSGFKNDIWYSGDGINWAPVIDKAPFSARYSHSTVVFNNKIWVIGGFDGTFNSDVWAFD